MRIGVLEWASCGGALGEEGLPASIRKEGWAMCRALLESLDAAGHNPVACLMPDLPTNSAWSSVAPLKSTADVRRQWSETYATCDATIVIAPESDGVLFELESWCAAMSIRTCSSPVEYILQAGDKWLTALRWRACPQVLHPETRLLSQWHARSQGDSAGDTWVLKARDGAGCTGMQCLSTSQLKTAQSTIDDNDCWIVQPWLRGDAYSRVAIVDSIGQSHWLPIVAQHLTVDRTVSYRGGCVLPEFRLSSEQADSLQCAVQSLGVARGWVGVDFLISPDGELIVIEINPRLTTSFVGLSRATKASLAEQIVRATLGFEVVLPNDWIRVEFDA